MRITGSLAIVAFAGFAAAAIAAGQSSPSSAPVPPAARQSPSTESGYVLKVRTRLVTLDVIATDSQGSVVRDLRPEELQVFEGRNQRQKIAAFEFIDTAASAAAPRPAGAAPARTNFYSNSLALEGLAIPPTVLLMDSLNSTTVNQMRARAHMLELLRTLPQDTPVAVYLLGNRARLVQSFTSDPALLRAAAEKALGLNATRIERNAQDDPNSPTRALEDIAEDPEMIQTVQFIQDFAKEQYANSIDLRARATLETLTSIARSLSGVRGRKNLIWFSESFPISIAPDPDFGGNPFAGQRVYEEDVKAAANALTDAQVAVYPVDLRGLVASQATAASERVPVRRGAAAGSIADIQSRERMALMQAQQTMDSLAEDTGGRTCKNSNDLSGCVATALKDGSSYYQVAFYPENIKWDGTYHRVTVRTSRRGVTLNYRRSYFAVDADALARSLKPEDQLRQACSDLLPSTSIPIVGQAVPPQTPEQQTAGHRYLFLIAPGGLSLIEAGGRRGVNAQAATCEFDAKEDAFQFSTQKLAGTVTDDIFQKWQAQGIPDFITLAPNPATRRVRFAVVDIPTGLTGALDVPVRPEDLEMVAPPAAPARPAAAPVTAVLAIPDRYAPDQAWQPRATGALTFNLPSGQSGTLDWNGDSLLYRGDMPIEQSASAFFSYAFGARFHCQAGALVANETVDGEAKLQVIVGNHDGRIATVDLKGEQTQYSGDLPVDPTARAFFDRIWRLARCQAP
jgi:VWFA-related protein